MSQCAGASFTLYTGSHIGACRGLGLLCVLHLLPSYTLKVTCAHTAYTAHTHTAQPCQGKDGRMLRRQCESFIIPPPHPRARTAKAILLRRTTACTSACTHVHTHTHKHTHSHHPAPTLARAKAAVCSAASVRASTEMRRRVRRSTPAAASSIVLKYRIYFVAFERKMFKASLKKPCHKLLLSPCPPSWIPLPTQAHSSDKCSSPTSHTRAPSYACTPHARTHTHTQSHTFHMEPQL